MYVHGPGTGYSIVAKLDAKTQMTRIKKSVNTQWDMVRLDSGVTGYVFREYTKVYPMVTSLSLKETELTMNVGESHRLEYNIGPDSAINKNVQWSSSNSNVVSVDDGNLTAKSGGEATITIKAVESGLTATCKVKVNSKVESISLPKENYTLIKDKYLTITPIIKPDGAQNKEYTITSSNENVVKVENLNLKGVNEGEATITFKTKDQNKTVSAKVKVIDVSNSDIINFNEDVKVDENNNKVSKISPETTIKNFVDKLSYNSDKYKIIVKNINDKEVVDEFVGTGTTINLVTKDTNDIIQTYNLVIFGDINGDGTINTIDLQLIQKSILSIKELSNIQKNAADLGKDGGNPTTIDLQRLQKHILNIKKIEQ